MSKLQTYIGTYTNKDSKGVYRMIFDTIKGTCDGPWLFYELQSPKALDCHKGELAIVCEQSEHAGVCMLDIHQPVPYHLDTKMGEEVASCFITQDESHVYTANYHEGTVIVYEKKMGKLRLDKRIKISDDAKCHQIFFYDEYMFVVCLGIDQIRIYDPSKRYAFVKEIPFPKGSGPRHVVMDASQNFLYVLTELSNELYVYKMGAHLTFRCQQINSVIPKGMQAESFSAAIRISPNGKFLYTSTRGINILTCFEIINGVLQLKDYYDCGGLHPRDFILEDSGRWLLVANKDSDNVIVFKLNPDDGTLLEETSEITIPSCVSLAFQKR